MSGPAFLLIYAALAAAANLWLRARFRSREAEIPARFMEIAQDPYQVAYLRQGARAAVQVAVFSLVDRNLLEATGNTVRRARADAASFARRPIEQAVLFCCESPKTVAAIENQIRVATACDGYESALVQRHLLADAQVFSQRFTMFGATFALLLGIAVARIYWAFAHGRSNVVFLIMLTLVGCGALAAAWRLRRTGLGDAALERFNVLFADLTRRAGELAPGGEGHEAALTAALFGFAALPTATYPYLQHLFPKPQSGGDGDGGGDSGGSSGGCGGGGGCGGCGG